MRSKQNQPDFAELHERGWTVFDSDARQESLLKIASSLGTPVPCKGGESLLTWLTPVAQTSEPRNTFSGVFGEGKFPLHTDTAHWPKPARYLILCDLGESHDRPTIVSRCDDILAVLDKADTGHAVWRVAGPTGYFPCSLTFWHGDDKGFRYDPLCMKPMNQAAKNVASGLSVSQFASQEISWNYGRAVIFDNWRVMHGRGASNSSDCKRRKLVRILVSDRSQP